MAIAILKRSFGPADTFVWKNETGSAISAGVPTLIKDTALNKAMIVVIPLTDLADDEAGTVYIAGEWTIDKGSNALATGQRLMYDVSEDVGDNESTCSGDTDFELGMVTVAAASGDDYVDFLLNEIPIYS